MDINNKKGLSKFISLAFVNDKEILVSRRNSIYIYNHEDNNSKMVVTLPCSFLMKLILLFPILARIFRSEIRYSIILSETIFLIVFNKKFYEININEGTFKEIFTVPRGRRPLSITNVFDNFERDEVNIYRRIANQDWEIVYTFPPGTIEHIHSIICDNINDCLWILSGDFNSAAAIWLAKKNFKEVKPVLFGDQSFRACVAFPTNEGLLYATDSQFEKNTIRLLKNNGKDWVSEILCEINGPAIYGCKIDNNFYFSTSVEGNPEKLGKFVKFLDKKPGPGIIENYSHIVGGNLNDGFRTLFKAEKDKLPFILFQFGVFTFPTGENKTGLLFTNPIALVTENDKCLIFNIKLKL